MDIKQTEKEILKEVRKKLNFAPKHIKVFKIIAMLIPVLLILYIFYSNLIISHDFRFFYDIGSLRESAGNAVALSPLNRISDAANESGITYRNLTSSLVYFDVPIPRGADSVQIEARIKPNFPATASMLIGAKNGPEWNYSYKKAYNTLLKNLGEFDYAGEMVKIYRINKDLPLVDNVSQIPKGSIVASDASLAPLTNNQNYEIKPLTINTSLRGGHTFYIYLKDNLDLKVKKQDINWYNGSDELTISLYDLNGNLISNATIPDDGIINVSSKIKAKIQEGKLEAGNLTGIYKLVFSDFDGLIREISINTDKIVTNKLFLADFDGYVKGIEKPSSIYTKSSRKSYLEFKTYHNTAFQNLTIGNDAFKINKTNALLIYTAEKGEYVINSSKNDIIISSPNYLSFSKENYFEPFKFTLTTIPTEIGRLRENYDYVVTEYPPIKEDGDWIIAQASFDIKDLYIEDDKLNVLLNTPHLGKNETLGYAIPIDWINVTVHKNGIFEKDRN
ncbi:MAG: hypothetical protein Q8O13_08560 [Candidatus Omnitrophota bacterium]|nr:hypothetical protein [Candidatus Omnitrophota bacterium]